MDDLTFLGDQIPSEVLRFLPVAQLVAPESAVRVAHLAVLFLSATEKAVSAARTSVPGELNDAMEAELKSSLEALQDKKSKRKLNKQELEHIRYAQQAGLFPVLFTGTCGSGCVNVVNEVVDECVNVVNEVVDVVDECVDVVNVYVWMSVC